MAGGSRPTGEYVVALAADLPLGELCASAQRLGLQVAHGAEHRSAASALRAAQVLDGHAARAEHVPATASIGFILCGTSVELTRWWAMTVAHGHLQGRTFR